MAIVIISVDTDDGFTQDFMPADSIPYITGIDVKMNNGDILPFVSPSAQTTPQA